MIEAGVHDCRFETTLSVTSGDVVFNERTDYFMINDTKVALPVAAVFELEDGKRSEPGETTST